MIAVDLAQLATALNAMLVGDNVQIKAVSTDTRHIDGDCLFVALKGERFDAHDFIAQAEMAGATALLVSHQVSSTLPQLVVEDTRIALGQLGAYVRQQLNPFTLALTGSCGKTTVKEMTTAILRQSSQVLATAGNFNNDIGAPLTLLRLTQDDKRAVIELGANHIGEIAYTTALVQPDVALINNLGESHLEGFGSLEGVAKAKGEIFEGLSEGGIAIINADSNDLNRWQPMLSDKQVLTFSASSSDADFTATDVTLDAQAIAAFTLHTPKGAIAVRLSLPGQHNVANALAAAALAQQAGASLDDIAAGLLMPSEVTGRVDVKTLSPTLTVIDDTYNASVTAMRAAIDLLANYDSRRILVLGDMKELGKESAHLHQNVAEYAAAKAFDTVLTFGEESAIISQLCGGVHFRQKDELNKYLLETLALMSTQPVTVLVKGGRSSRMEEVVTALQESMQ
uniref:UDP-N-acetylmuramoyl-tripeptide--D-alanyl-D- alanine ligase n=1 Tax=Thaumasiovibrio occultus TaxID=1891184 RepID=UPI000B3602F4|nr:UDP-N-acetylmuramoyl-tripeptide--D-alanyl-D-alanine ligase [Thaumasiovibrio occultus]